MRNSDNDVKGYNDDVESYATKPPKCNTVFMMYLLLPYHGGYTEVYACLNGHRFAPLLLE